MTRIFVVKIKYYNKSAGRKNNEPLPWCLVVEIAQCSVFVKKLPIHINVAVERIINIQQKK